MPDAWYFDAYYMDVTCSFVNAYMPIEFTNYSVKCTGEYLSKEAVTICELCDKVWKQYVG